MNITSEHSSSQYTGDSHDQEDGFEKETIFESETGERTKSHSKYCKATILAMIIRFSSQEPRCDFMLLLIIDEESSMHSYIPKKLIKSIISEGLSYLLYNL